MNDEVVAVVAGRRSDRDELFVHHDNTFSRPSALIQRILPLYLPADTLSLPLRSA
jgi:hypothetical protein